MKTVEYRDRICEDLLAEVIQHITSSAMATNVSSDSLSPDATLLPHSAFRRMFWLLSLLQPDMELYATASRLFQNGLFLSHSDGKPMAVSPGPHLVA